MENKKKQKKRDFFPVEVAQSRRGFSLFNDRGGRLGVGEYRAMTEGACELVLNRERWEEVGDAAVSYCLRVGGRKPPTSFPSVSSAGLLRCVCPPTPWH